MPLSFLKPWAVVLLIAQPAHLAAGTRPQDPAPATLNTPSVNDWSVYGPGQTHKLRRDADVAGGGAMRVDVTKVPAAVYEIGASVPVTGAIRKGDKLLVAFWGRLVAGGVDGKSDIPVVSQIASPPYAPIIAGTVTLGAEWKLVSIKGVAAADHAAGSTNVVLQLGGGRQRIDLGPAYVMLVE